MKNLSIKIFITVLISVILGSCTNDNNPVNFSGNGTQHENSDSHNRGKDTVLIWSRSAMKIFIDGQRFVWDTAGFTFNFDTTFNFFITYDGWATPDTTNYISACGIALDGSNIFTEIGELYINRHHELDFRNLTGNRLVFHIGLWCDEIECTGYAAMEISNIKVYKYL